MLLCYNPNGDIKCVQACGDLHIKGHMIKTLWDEARVYHLSQSSSPLTEKKMRPWLKLNLSVSDANEPFSTSSPLSITFICY